MIVISSSKLLDVNRMLTYIFSFFLIIVTIATFNKQAFSQMPVAKKSIYFSIDTFSNDKKKLYNIYNNPRVHDTFGSDIKFNYPCYYNGEYSPSFLQFRKTIKIISKRDIKRLQLMSDHDFLEIICRYGISSLFLLEKYDIYFVEKLKKRRYLLYKVMSSAPPRIE